MSDLYKVCNRCGGQVVKLGPFNDFLCLNCKTKKPHDVHQITDARIISRAPKFCRACGNKQWLLPTQYLRYCKACGIENPHLVALPTKEEEAVAELKIAALEVRGKQHFLNWAIFAVLAILVIIVAPPLGISLSLVGVTIGALASVARSKDIDEGKGLAGFVPTPLPPNGKAKAQSRR